MSKTWRTALATALFFTAVIAGGAPVFAQTSVLSAQFTGNPITVDGVAEAAWDAVPAAALAICMTPDLSAQTAGSPTSGTVKATWDGPVMYLLFTVTDPEITVSSSTDTSRDGIELYVDQYNDKFPKFEEDDSYIRISADGRQTGNSTNAGLKTFNTSWYYHLKSFAAAYRSDDAGNRIGYCVEVAWQIGDRPLMNGTKLGMEFSINECSTVNNNPSRTYRLFWSDGNNKGLDNNSLWGEVALEGFSYSSPLQLNTFMLNVNIAKANALVRGIWESEKELDAALSKAVDAQSSASQWEIDAANLALDRALRHLRRSGKYPDPKSLVKIDNLNDPFTFFNGRRVTSLADWDKRREEIKDIAQYYEYGYMPEAPESMTVTESPAVSWMGVPYTAVKIEMTEGGNTASFTAALALPTSGTGPYPVIVSLDFWANPPAPTSAYLSAGYAVLSIPASDYSAWFGPAFAGVATDDDRHGGTYFKLYPYDVAAGKDAGVLMAWAWGASRGADALQHLKANGSSVGNLLDLDKLVVTGFSRMGKAALFAGMMDERFKVTAPGGSGSGGAAPYRYDSFGNSPYRSEPFGNVYPWGTSPGTETMGDHARHQTHNSNEMFLRFLNDTVPAAVVPRMYKTDTHGYGARMPFDHHMIIAAIAPRAVIIANTNDDYADNAEGDSIGYEGAKPVYRFLGVEQNLALDLYMGGGGHSLKPSQEQNIVAFADMVLKGTPMAEDVKTHLATDPYLDAGTYDKYYGGLDSMMPWAKWMPHANLLTGLSISAGTVGPNFNPYYAWYGANVYNSVRSISLTPVSEDPKASITVNGQDVTCGQASQDIPLEVGFNGIRITVTSRDGAARSYMLTVWRLCYDFGGFLPPLSADGSGGFKAGSTIPVKFQLKDTDGNSFPFATASLFIAKVENGTAGREMPASAAGGSSFGNLFRYDPKSRQYVFNLGTKRLAKGTYQIRVDLGDGYAYKVQFSIT